jgi:threonylcarbamoyladenosine tRNA methylthiotransferase CDKAL1
VPASEVKERTKVLSEMFRAHMPFDGRARVLHVTASRFLQTQIGQRYKVLVTEEGADGKHFVGHNKFYEQVRL